MDRHIRDYFSPLSKKNPHSPFHRAIILNEVADLESTSLFDQFPGLPKGWFELTQLSTFDRIAFTFDFWLAQLPYQPHLEEGLSRFFNSLDDLVIVVTQRQANEPFEAHMVYSLDQDRGFFCGDVPAKEREIEEIKNFFSNCILPEDFLAFLQIHNGFRKATDTTGVFSTEKMCGAYSRFLDLVEGQEIPVSSGDQVVDPSALLPFYESFGMPYFQCFWSDWYPGPEMGNVYYSIDGNAISAVQEGGGAIPEQMAFPTFCDWLLFYLEEIS